MLYYFQTEPDKCLLFVDILGFSNQVKYRSVNIEDAPPDEMKLDFKSFYNVVSDYFSGKQNCGKAFDFSWMSDSIVLSSSVDNIDFILESLVYLHNHMIVGGMALRGAICVGNLYHAENIWGEALVRAAHLEKQVCKLPHIIISNDDYEKLNISEKYKQYFYDWSVKECNSQYKGFNATAAHIDSRLSNNVSVVNSTIQAYSEEIKTNYKNAPEKSDKDNKLDKAKYKWAWLAKQFIDVLEDEKRAVIIEKALTAAEVQGKKVQHIPEIIKELRTQVDLSDLI